ncbi:MAG: hypothetical protein ACO1SV_24775 [Fimbriimonas sp.]
MEAQRRKDLFIGSILLIAGTNLPGLLPSRFDFLGWILAIVGVQIFSRNLRRSTVELGFRLFLGVLMVPLARIMAARPDIGALPAMWVAQMALLVGIVGSAVPKRVRRNAYGMLLAILWVLALGSLVEFSPGSDSDLVLGVFMGVTSLAAMTYGFLAWERTGYFPIPLQRYIDRLPDDEPMAISARPAMVGIPSPVQTRAEEHRITHP